MPEELDEDSSRPRLNAGIAAVRVFLATGALVVLPLALFVALVLPLASLILTTSPGDLLGGLRNPLVAPALRLSLTTTSISTLFVVATGTPLAWFLARRTTRAIRTLEVLVQIPVVIPPAVAGIALLLAFGRQGLFGAALNSAGVSLPFTRGAVVLAEIFVSAPFFIQAAIDSFRRINEDYLVVARSLGAGRSR
ncbi:MAG: molybdate ABC transporter permease subunit, partial [Deltaproteobacteria bacterium]|nr:molybdate ABC transporter permease subunit [Deltaproteobacteria bacterium]